LNRNNAGSVVLVLGGSSSAHNWFLLIMKSTWFMPRARLLLGIEPRTVGGACFRSLPKLGLGLRMALCARPLGTRAQLGHQRPADAPRLDHPRADHLVAHRRRWRFAPQEPLVQFALIPDPVNIALD